MNIQERIEAIQETLDELKQEVEKEVERESCDIDLSKCTQEHSGAVTLKKVPVMFDHDQEDGKSKTTPYFEIKELDICERCFDQITRKRELVYAYGTMGYNAYKLSNDA